MARTKKQVEPRCAWTWDCEPDMDSWDTACGEKFQFTDGGPRENHFRYCYSCGRPLKIVTTCK